MAYDGMHHTAESVEEEHYAHLRSMTALQGRAWRRHQQASQRGAFNGRSSQENLLLICEEEAHQRNTTLHAQEAPFTAEMILTEDRDAWRTMAHDQRGAIALESRAKQLSHFQGCSTNDNRKKLYAQEAARRNASTAATSRTPETLICSPVARTGLETDLEKSALR